MPLVAQVTGAVALTALIVGPWWASAPDAIESAETAAATPAAAATTTALPAAAIATSPAVPAEVTPAAPAPLPPAAHLNLDIRHSFGHVDFYVTIDGKPAIQARLEGSGKRFGVFGKRSERGHTRTIELTPGVHLVRIRVASTDDKFDQMRVERFDLGSAAVASMRISADKSGLSLIADRPPAPGPAAPTAVASAPPAAPPVTATSAAPVQAGATVPTSGSASRQDINALTDLLYSVRSMLIWIAGFVATTATAFLFEEWLKKRKQQLLALGRLSRRRHRQRPEGPTDNHAQPSAAGTEPGPAS